MEFSIIKTKVRFYYVLFVLLYLDAQRNKIKGMLLILWVLFPVNKNYYVLVRHFSVTCR